MCRVFICAQCEQDRVNVEIERYSCMKQYETPELQDFWQELWSGLGRTASECLVRKSADSVDPL